MAEFWPFIFAGAIAVAAAIMMLLSENAVHSSLFLIVTMVSIAFLFLLLNAPFLAMIQITVYAGAIMVLFLFVIMLLGAERLEPANPGEGRRRYRWFTPLALTLAASLLISFGLSIIQGQISAQPLPQRDPQVRALHAAADAGTVDVYAGDTLLINGLQFGDSTGYLTLPPGETTVTLRPSGQAATVPGEIIASFDLQPNTTQTIVAYGVDAPTLAIVPDNNDTVERDRNSRITVFNAYTGAPAINVVDITDGFPRENAETYVADLPTGQLSQPFLVEEGTQNWGYAPSDSTDELVARARDVELDRDQSQLVVLAPERLFDGTLRVVPITAGIEARPAFGSPRAVGYLLFTDYLLPFQLIALLLLAAMVGVIVLTQREFEKPRQRVTGRRRVSRSLASVVAAQVGQDISGEDDTPRLPDTTPEPATADEGR